MVVPVFIDAKIRWQLPKMPLGVTGETANKKKRELINPARYTRYLDEGHLLDLALQVLLGGRGVDTRRVYTLVAEELRHPIEAYPGIH